MSAPTGGSGPVRRGVNHCVRIVRRAPRRFSLGAVVGGLLVSLVRRWGASADGTQANLLGGAPLDSFCASGLLPMADGACYAAPPDAVQESKLPLVLYLHGLFERGPMEDEERDRQRRVARQATARGFAVLALRGAEGACHSERTTLVCWPSNERSAEKAPAFVAAWQPALRAAEKKHPFTDEYVFGFSNGGYFAGLIAEKVLYKADAFVIAHAGPVEPVRGVGGKPPLLLMSADEDVSQEGMVQLDDELARDDWPHEHYVRDGGHALPDSDIDVALTFFERTRSEPLPLRPPISSRVPRARLARRVAENSTLAPTSKKEETRPSPGPSAAAPASVAATASSPSAPESLDADPE
jgi:dienelactone hydrolase